MPGGVTKVGVPVGVLDGRILAEGMAEIVGGTVGVDVGITVGVADGSALCVAVGTLEGRNDGDDVGTAVPKAGKGKVLAAVGKGRGKPAKGKGDQGGQIVSTQGSTLHL